MPNLYITIEEDIKSLQGKFTWKPTREDLPENLLLKIPSGKTKV